MDASKKPNKSESSEPWLAKDGEKRGAVQSMFAEISPTYDRLNGWMSLFMHRRWRRQAVNSLRLKPGDNAIDVCTGTGDFLTPLRKAVGNTGTLVGFDFCRPMLLVGKAKDVPGSLAVADALALPVASKSVQAVTVGWGIRNVADIDAAHREIFRILSPEGRFVSIDTAQPENPAIRSVSKFALTKVLPCLGRLVRQKRAYTYLPESTLRFWNRNQLAESMQKAGFINVKWKNLMLGNICMHWGQKP